MMQQKPRVSQLLQWLERQWYSPGRSIWPILTWPLAQLFGALAAHQRRRLTRRATAPDLPVIIVGNIHVGGTGKSPIVQALALALATRGHCVGVLLRGYKGQSTSKDWPLQVDAQTSARLAGDEAVMHAQYFAQLRLASDAAIIVVVDPDRVRGAALLESLGVALILCDDGLQHYRLQRDCEIVVLNSDKGVGQGRLLPAGPLREPVSRLLAVDCLFSSSPLPVSLLQQQPLLVDHFWRYQLRTGAPIPLINQGYALTKEQCDGVDTIVAIAGIAQPSRFFASVRQQGFSLVEEPLSDHHGYSLSDIRRLSRYNKPVIMTGKDAVKIRQILQELNVLSDQGELDQAQAHTLHILHFCCWAFVLPYQAILDDAVVDKVLSIALKKHKVRCGS